jgi:hypothetical protein
VAETVSVQRQLSREAKIGVAAVGSVIATRIVLGNFVVNEWEGWDVFLPTAIGAVIEGLVLGGLVFALLVRLAARSRGARPAITALVVGVLAVLSLAIPYSAPQVILGAAAVALGLVAVERGLGAAFGRAAIALGSLVIATWIAFMGFAVVTGDWPVGGG